MKLVEESNQSGHNGRGTGCSRHHGVNIAAWRVAVVAELAVAIDEEALFLRGL